MKTTAYFEQEVLRKRPYLRREWCEQAISQPITKSVQADGRIRCWIYAAEIEKYIRVVLLPDGETVLNAFPDRNFEPPSS